MNILIAGTGYVGLVTGSCFADLGVNVTCVDDDARTINLLLYGGLPIYEQGLEAMVKRNMSEGRLHFSTDFDATLADGDIDYVFCAVETPPLKDDSTDLTRVMDIVHRFARGIKRYTVLVMKSTVPVGTAEEIKKVIAADLAELGKSDVEFDVVTNPDFLTEGNAIKDFIKPDRIVVGVDSPRARAAMDRLYHPLHNINSVPVVVASNTTAEMIKYAATSMLATRISFMNEIANLCEIVGADVNIVRRGVGTDSRIGPKYIYPGCGYGGTLFPKDIKDLIKIGERNNYSMDVLKAVRMVNKRQKRILFEKLKRHFGGELQGKTVAVWGLSFKPETNDIRSSPALTTIERLIEAGCNVRVFDPVAMNQFKQRWNEIYCALDIYDAVDGADAALLVTEWRQFRVPDWKRIRGIMRTPVIIDGRNIYDYKELEENGFTYYCVGR